MSRLKKGLSKRSAQSIVVTVALIAILILVGPAIAGPSNPGQWVYYGGGGGAARAAPDITAPTIYGDTISTFNITSDGADISWDTDEASDTGLEYGTSPSTFTPVDPTLVTHHTVHLSDLTPETTYWFKCRSKDAAGNLTVSDKYTFTTLAAPDITPPVISDVAASETTTTGATISWTTDEPSTSQVEYWVTTSSLTPLDTTLVTSHSVTLTDLTPETTYHFKVRSSDAAGNLAVSTEYSFTTLPYVVLFPWWGILLIVLGVAALGVGGWLFLWRRRA